MEVAIKLQLIKTRNFMGRAKEPYNRYLILCYNIEIDEVFSEIAQAGVGG